MDCGHLQELSLWFDDELGPEEKARFERHMDGCDSCRRARGELLALREGLRSADPGVEREQQDRTLRRILASRRSPLWRRRVPVPVPALAALVLAAMALTGMALRAAWPPVSAGPERGQKAPTRPVLTGEPEPGTHAPSRFPGSEGRGGTSMGRDHDAGINLARFDHGERAVLYKIPRPADAEAVR